MVKSKPKEDQVPEPVVSDEIGITKKKVDEMSLDEIKSELERRKLDFEGDDYAILHERLTDSMIEEGLDPQTYEFEFEVNQDDEEEEDSEDVSAENKELKNANEGASKGEVKQEKKPLDGKDVVKETQKGKAGKEAEVKAEKVYKTVEGNHLWVSGLTSRAKAADLKKFFARYATVTSAKIVANARTKSSRCYGYITVESNSDLEKCVLKLHRTRFEGSLINVELCKLEPADALRKSETKDREDNIKARDDFKKKKEDKEKIEREKKNKEKKVEVAKGSRKSTEVKKGGGDVKKDDKKPLPNASRRGRSRSPPRRKDDRRSDRGPRRGSFPPRGRGGPIRSLSRRSPVRRGRSPSPFGHNGAPFNQSHHAPINEVMLRKLERDRRADEQERVEIERRQRAEAEALERERRQLKMEREKLERDKLELVRLERERVKKEMEEIAAKKEAERRRQEELIREEDNRRRQEEHARREHMEMSRRGRNDNNNVRGNVPVPIQSNSMDLYDPRAPLPVDDFQRKSSSDDKFAGRLGPPMSSGGGRESGRDSGRHDRRDDRGRRDSNAMVREERRPPEPMDPWGNVSGLKRETYMDHNMSSNVPAKKTRSRSPNRNGFNTVLAEYPRSGGPSHDPWVRGGQAPSLVTVSHNQPSMTGSYQDRRAPERRVVIDNQSSASSWGGGGSASSANRVAFPPAYGDAHTRTGLLGSNPGSFGGIGSVMSSSGGSGGTFRRY